MSDVQVCAKRKRLGSKTNVSVMAPGPLQLAAKAKAAARVATAAAKKAAGQFDDSGQVCMAGTRLIVEESVRADF